MAETNLRKIFLLGQNGSLPRHVWRDVCVHVERDVAHPVHGKIALDLVGPVHLGDGDVGHAYLQHSLVLPPARFDGEALLNYGLATHEGRRGNDDGADELCVSVVLVANLEEELLAKVAHLRKEDATLFPAQFPCSLKLPPLCNPLPTQG